MQKEATKIILKEAYEGVRETSSGFRINRKELSPTDLKFFMKIKNATVGIKRSGTGVVVIIECF